MPRVKVPRAGRALKLLWHGPTANPHAPAKTIAVRKFTTTHGTLAQQKVSGAGSQLPDCRNRKSPVTGSSVRALTTADRIPTFAAAPYLKLIKRELWVDSAPVVPALPSPSLPSPSFAARPLWKNGSAAAADVSPQTSRQAAIRAKLARTPLYAYAQLQGGRGVHKHSARAASTAASTAAAKSGKVSAKESQALKWFGHLDGSGRATSAGRRQYGSVSGRPRSARRPM